MCGSQIERIQFYLRQSLKSYLSLPKKVFKQLQLKLSFIRREVEYT